MKRDLQFNPMTNLMAIIAFLLLDNVPILAKRGTNKTGTIMKGNETGEYELELPEGSSVSITFDMSGKDRLIIDNVLAKPKQNKQQRFHVVLKDVQHVGLSRADVEKFFVDSYRGYAFARAEGLSPLELRRRNLARFVNVAKSEVYGGDEGHRVRLDQLSTLYQLSNSTPQPVVSEDSKFVAVATEERTFSMFDIATTEPVYSWQENSFSPQRVVSVEGNRWYGIDHGMNVAKFTPGTAEPMKIRTGKDFAHCHADFSPDDTSYICADLRGRIEKIDYMNGQSIWRLDRRGKPLQIAVSRVGTLATIDTRGKVSLLSAQTGEVLWSSKFNTKLRPHALAFSRDGKRLALAAGYFSDGQLFVYDARDGRPIAESLADNKPVAIASVTFSPEGDTLATGNVVAQTIDLWNVDRATKPFKSFPIPGFTGGLTFDPSGNALLVTTSHGGIEKIDVSGF